MRAVVVTELSGPDGMTVQEVPEPQVDGAVLIDVRASGVCFPDLLISYDCAQDAKRKWVQRNKPLAAALVSASTGDSPPMAMAHTHPVDIRWRPHSCAKP